jgi:hypothetical protein
MDVPARVVSGLTPPAKALFVASAAHARPHAVILYVLPGDGDLEEACSDVTFFLAALEGLTPAGVELAVLSYPSHEVDPYRGLAPHVGVTSARARVLHGIARPPPEWSSPPRRRCCRACRRRTRCSRRPWS